MVTSQARSRLPLLREVVGGAAAGEAGGEVEHTDPGRAHRDPGHPHAGLVRLGHRGPAGLLALVADLGQRVLGTIPSTSVTSARPRSSSTSGGVEGVSIVIATSGRARRAAILRAPANVPKTISSPVQWKSIGNTRGVPSAAV